MSAADQNVLAQAGLRPDPQAEFNSNTDPRTGISTSQDPFQSLPINSVPRLDIPIGPSGPAAYQQPGTMQQVPGTDLSRDPFDTSHDPATLAADQQNRERAAAIQQATKQPNPPPSDGSLGMSQGTRYNPQGEPTGVIVAPPVTIQDGYHPDSESAPMVANIPGSSQPISLAPGIPVDPFQGDISRPALGDPTVAARNPISLAPQPEGGTNFGKLKELLGKSGTPLTYDSAGRPTVATGVATASPPSLTSFIPLAAAVVVAFILFGHK